MCGIAGNYEWKQSPDSTLVEKMTTKIQHRGPDGAGIESFGPVCFGHRRLAIIDLTENGKQPMFDHKKNFCVTFNGEIYNYIELKEELKQLGCHFHSDSDTEVILESYRMWGIDCLEKFNGMFAFALWDSLKNQMILARDRTGKKPLYFSRTPSGGMIFASEIKSLLESKLVSRKLNLNALSDFLRLNYVLGNHSIFEGIEKLRPGHYLVVNGQNPWEQKSYWDLSHHFKNKLDIEFNEAKTELLRLFDSSVALRMISDVPLGAFLSGGIDSSSIVASMQARARQNHIRTFTIGFKEKSYSEADEARSISKHIGTRHEERVVDVSLSSHLKDIVYFADEPFADSSMIPTYFLSQFTREFVTVALSGDGGDELFAGYETYLANKIHDGLKRLPRFLAQPIQSLANLLPSSFEKVSFDYKVKKFLASHSLTAPEAHYFWRTIFSQSELQELLQDSVKEAVLAHDSFNYFDSHFCQVQECHPLDQALYVDTKTWLPDDILVKADRMSMAHSLELRCPFLDYRLLEFAAALPPEWKMRGTVKKFILKESQLGRLPEDVVFRKKRGFNAPVSHWFTEDLSNILMAQFEHLSALIKIEVVQRLLDDHKNRKVDNSLKLLSLLNLGLWMGLNEPTR